MQTLVVDGISPPGTSNLSFGIALRRLSLTIGAFIPELMAKINLRSWPEVSQASEDLQLNSITATMEYILAWHDRLETRLIDHECRDLTHPTEPHCTQPHSRNSSSPPTSHHRLLTGKRYTRHWNLYTSSHSRHMGLFRTCCRNPITKTLTLMGTRLRRLNSYNRFEPNSRPAGTHHRRGSPPLGNNPLRIPTSLIGRRHISLTLSPHTLPSNPMRGHNRRAITFNTTISLCLCSLTTQEHRNSKAHRRLLSCRPTTPHQDLGSPYNCCR